VYYPEPITVLELAEIVRDAIIKDTYGKIQPPIEIVDKGMPPIFSEEDKAIIKVDTSKVKKLLGISSLLSPKESIENIVRNKLKSMTTSIFVRAKDLSQNRRK